MDTHYWAAQARPSLYSPTVTSHPCAAAFQYHGEATRHQARHQPIRIPYGALAVEHAVSLSRLGLVRFWGLIPTGTNPAEARASRSLTCG